MSLSTTHRPEDLHTSLGVQHSNADLTSTEQDSATATRSEAATIRPTFTITDAATACSVSRKTITRKLPELAGHGAAKDDDGVWRIPVEALLAVGLHPGRSLPQVTAPVRPSAPAPSHARPADPETVTISRDRWDDVRIRLARAEAEASERGLALADARLALRALTAGPLPSPAAPSIPEETVALSESGAPEAADFQGAHGPRPMGQEFGAPVVLGSRGSPTAAPRYATVPNADVPGPAGSGGPAATGAEPAPGDVVAARNLAARTGGYVPAVAAPAKKRRWWQSH